LCDRHPYYKVAENWKFTIICLDISEFILLLEVLLDGTQEIRPGAGMSGGVLQQLTPGTVLMGRYAIQDVIGVGGMGSVYSARDLHFPTAIKLVAVKEMLNNARDPLVRKTIVQNFEREANILVTLNHPAIPKIFDYFTYEERSYLVLEIVHGIDLEALMHNANLPISEEQVIAWAIEICDVLDYLHNLTPEPIIFRDMKPSNIMINQSGHVVMVDFGIAKNFHEGQKGTMIGTEGYSPPEQYRGEASPQADIYSLGATMHHLLTLRDPRLEPPFSFSERPVRVINPDVSVELEAVINRALLYNPAERFSSAREMKDAIIHAGRKSGSLRKVTTVDGGGKDPTTRQLWIFKCEDEIRATPVIDNGVIYVGAYDNNLYAIDINDGKFIWKYPTEGGIVSRPVIKDNFAYFGSEDGRLHAISTKTGKISWSYDTGAPVRNSPVLIEGHVVIGSDNGSLYGINLATYQPSWRADIGSPIRSSPCFTGEHFVVGSDAGEMVNIDTRGQIRWRFKSKKAITSTAVFHDKCIYFSALDGVLYSLDAKSGWVIWRFRMEKGSTSSPCIFEHSVIVGSADYNLYCVDIGNGKEIWRYKMGHQVSGSPVVSGDSVYCGCADGGLYCLDAHTGQLRWKFFTGKPITSAPVIQADVVYIGSLDHNLYALVA